MRVLEQRQLIPSHRKPPWQGYVHSLRLFTKLLLAHPLPGISRPIGFSATESARHIRQLGGTIPIRGHSAGSYSGMLWQSILSKFPGITGHTVLVAIAFPHTLIAASQSAPKQQRHLMHHHDDRLCVWKASKLDLEKTRQRGLKVTYITGWRGYLGSPAQFCTLDESRAPRRLL